MPACEFEKEGIITDVYGRFSLAVPFNLNGRVLIKADALCLKLRTGSRIGGDGEHSNSTGNKSKGIFHGADGDGASMRPNLAKILTIGDRVSFDAVALEHPSASSSGAVGWLASPGSLRVVEVCTRTKLYHGYGNIIEISTKQGMLSFADKKVSFDTSASFPLAINDLAREYKLGDMVSFVAVEQSQVTELCHWRAISVERYSLRSALPSCRVPYALVPTPPPLLPPPAQRQSVFAPMDFTCTSDSPPQVMTPPFCAPNRQRVPDFKHASGFQTTRKPFVGDSSPRRDRIPKNPAPPPPSQRELPPDFDMQIYSSLPERMKGHGRIVYYGPRCSLLEDSETGRKAFFLNTAIRYPSRRGSCRKPVEQGSIVYFEAERTTLRANLGAYYDAKIVDVVEGHEEKRWKSRWEQDDAGGDGRSASRSSSSVSSSSSSTNTTSGKHTNADFNRKRRTVLPSTNPLAIDFSTGPEPVPVSNDRGSSTSKPTIGFAFSHKRQKVDDDAETNQPPSQHLSQLDARHRIKQARAKKSFEIDRDPIDDKIEKVHFNRKPASYSEVDAPLVVTASESINAGSETDQACSSSSSSSSVINVGGGDTRRCVLRSSPSPPPTRENADPSTDFDDFMAFEENLADKFEFDDDS